MRLGFWLRVLCLALACLAWPRAGLAEERVRIVTDDRDSLLYRQLLVELTAAGFSVLSDAEEQEAVAVVVARDSEDVIEVQVQASGRLLLRTLERDPERDTPRVVALRTVELLRACLREAARPIPETRPAPKKEPPPAPAPGPSPSLLEVSLGPALLASPGGLDAFPGLGARAMLWPAENFGLGAAGFYPFGQKTLTAPEGSADVTLILVGGGLAHRLFLSSSWQLETSAWAGAALLRTEGSASDLHAGKKDNASSFALHGSLALSHSLSDAVFVQAMLLLGGLLPEAEIRFADRTAAHWGAPYGMGALSLGLRLF